MHWGLWGDCHLGQAKRVNCNQILGQVADENYIAIPESLGIVSRKPQYKDVYRRTIEIRVHYEPLNSNKSIKCECVMLKLPSPISG